MALDTLYRPQRFSEVVGQEATTLSLCQFIKSGTGFHQSYVFSGGHGGGKTTIGRILARALLCENPEDGEPCDKCSSCRTILAGGSSECFFEVDAATNSGKDDVKKITESLQYSTFSGKRRIYLFDEAHQLSKNALDALLKPMEDSAPGSQEKMLVCIFCTTEPEKMRRTIFSRCAPAYSLRPVTPEAIAERLAYICGQEGIEHEQEALVLVAEVCESHIRDSIKAVEGVSKMGMVSRENVTEYLKLSANGLYLDILANLGHDLPRVSQLVDELVVLVSPTTCYEKLVEASMMVYRASLGVIKVPAYWDAAQVKKVGDLHKQYLIAFASKLASRVGRPTMPMLLCDLAHLHHGRQGSLAVLGNTIGTQTAKAPPPRLPTQTQTPSGPPTSPVEGNSTSPDETSPAMMGKVESTKPERSPYVTSGGTFVDPRARKKRATETADKPKNELSTELFSSLLRIRVGELSDGDGRGSP